jgi:hypothetical protein
MVAMVFLLAVVLRYFLAAPGAALAPAAALPTLVRTNSPS